MHEPRQEKEATNKRVQEKKNQYKSDLKLLIGEHQEWNVKSNREMERERVRNLRNEDRGRTKRDSNIPAGQWSAGRRDSRSWKREIQGETKVEKERKKDHGGRRMIFISDLGCVWFLRLGFKSVSIEFVCVTKHANVFVTGRYYNKTNRYGETEVARICTVCN